MLGAVVFFAAVLPGPVSLCRQGAGGPYPENMPWVWACLSVFLRKVVGFTGAEPKSPL